MTQEVLADRCGLSADTIRRLEHGSFSPSLETLNKLGRGFDLQLSTLFECFELGERDTARELLDLIAGRADAVIEQATHVVRAFLSALDACDGCDDETDLEPEPED